MDKNIIGTTKVTRNGQITLSKKVRDELGIDIGDYVAFEKIEDKKLFIYGAEIKIKNNDKQD